MATSAEHRSKFEPFTDNGDVSNEWKIREWDEKQTNNKLFVWKIDVFTGVPLYNTSTVHFEFDMTLCCILTKFPDIP